MTGLSGSPSSKATTTSWPTRGQKQAPQPLPAHDWATLTQQDSPLAERSQGKFTCTRPNLSMFMGPGPTTVAVQTPPTRGLGRGGQWACGRARGASSARTCLVSADASPAQ